MNSVAACSVEYQLAGFCCEQLSVLVLFNEKDFDEPKSFYRGAVSEATCK